ncbi:MAG: polysaccharide biosynthesis/export family protein [Gammaproteobacteria bacterium]|nr:polysaccharide biosynthesis/export family protein [Gammaproteobacteria bacterium]
MAAPLLAACATGRGDSDPGSDRSSQRSSYQARATVENLNRDLAAALGRQDRRVHALAGDAYRVGPGDVLNIAVFQVDELNRKVRVNAKGEILIPLLGVVSVGGHSVAEVESLLAAQLGEKFLRNPQVSIFIEEYRSQQVTVMGSVKQPSIYSIREPRTVLEMLSEAGGLSEEAGTKIYAQAIAEDPISGKPVPQKFVIDLGNLLEGVDPRLNIVLRGGDSVYVPKAGMVFVEGAVRKPGAYRMQGNTNVMKAITMAGGPEFQARQGGIQIFRQRDGENQIIELDLDRVRDNTRQDVTLLDGDVVVVPSSAVKTGFAGFWRGVSGLFTFSRGF